MFSTDILRESTERPFFIIVRNTVVFKNYTKDKFTEYQIKQTLVPSLLHCTVNSGHLVKTIYFLKRAVYRKVAWT